MPLPHTPPPPPCAPAVFLVEAQNDPNTGHGTVVLQMLSGPKDIGTDTFQTIHLENLDNCLSVKFTIDKKSASAFATAPLVGDREFVSPVATADPDHKIRNLQFQYKNSYHAVFESGIHEYSLYFTDYSTTPFPTRYVVDPKVENRPPANSPLLILELIILAGGAELLIAFTVARVHLWWVKRATRRKSAAISRSRGARQN